MAVSQGGSSNIDPKDLDARKLSHRRRDYFDDSALPNSDIEYDIWPTPESKNLEKRLARARFLKWVATTSGLILAIVTINLLGYLIPGPFDEIGLDVITAIIYAYINSQK